MDRLRGAPIFRLIVLSRLDATTKWSGDIATIRGKTKPVYQNHSRQIMQAWSCASLRVLNTADHGKALSRALRLAAEPQSTGHLSPGISDVPPRELLTALCAEASASGPPTAPPAQRPARGTSPPYLFRQNGPTSTRWLAYLPIPDWQPKSAMPPSRVTYVSGPPGPGKTSVAPIYLLGLLEHLRPYPAAIINSGFRRPGVRQPLPDCAF